MLLQTKKEISMSYGSSTSSWKPCRWTMLDLILMMREIYINSTWTNSQNSLAAAEALILKILSHGTSLKWSQRPFSMRIVISYWWNSFEFNRKSMETETTTWSKFLNEEKPIVEQILASKERSKSKRAGLWESQAGIRVGKLTIWVRFLREKKYIRVHQVYQFHQNRLASRNDEY